VAGEAQDSQTLRRVFEAALARGRGSSQVFGLRQQRQSAPALFDALTRAYPGLSSDRDRLTEAFGPLRFLYLTRDDKLAQAVSLLRAQGSGLWHLGADGTEVERNAPQRVPGYDRQAIADTIALFTSYDALWQAWFDGQGISPLRLSYEALARDPQAVLARVLTDLGQPAEQAASIPTPLARLACKETEDWIARYRADPLVSPV
jgi:LPS sulfotransferase NodH